MSTQTRSYKGNNYSIEHPNHHSIQITTPVAISHHHHHHHHYIKRSSQLSYPQLPLEFKLSNIPLNSINSCSSNTSAKSTTNSQKRNEQMPKSPIVSTTFRVKTNTSSIISTPEPIKEVTRRSSRPLTQMMQPKSNLPPIQPLIKISHLPIQQPSIKKSNLDHLLQSLPPPPPYILNLPSPDIHLDLAMKAQVVDRFGTSVNFENLIDPDFKTLVIFIRHFRCGYSQRYIQRLSKIENGENVEKIIKNNNNQEELKSTCSNSNLNSEGKHPQQLENWISANGVKVIIIGHGNYQLIESYKKILNCPFPIYTDLSKDQRVYKLLGMKKIKDITRIKKSPANEEDDGTAVSYDIQTSNKFKSSSNQNLRRGGHGGGVTLHNHNEPLIQNGESKMAFLSQVIYNAWRMPWKWSGDPQQLGGEIIFEPIRQENRIKRKPIKPIFMNEKGSHLTKSNSIRSNSSSLATTVNTTTNTFDQDSFDSVDRSFNLSPIRKPSCTIKKNYSINRRQNNINNNSINNNNSNQIQIQLKFIHQMIGLKDHFSIDQLLIQSGIRLTSLIQKF